MCQRACQPAPVSLVCRQAETQARRSMKTANKNALTGKKLVQLVSLFAQDPLKQSAATGRRQAMSGQQVRQSLAVGQETFTLTGLPCTVSEQSRADEP